MNDNGSPVGDESEAEGDAWVASRLEAAYPAPDGAELRTGVWRRVAQRARARRTASAVAMVAVLGAAAALGVRLGRGPDRVTATGPTIRSTTSTVRPSGPGVTTTVSSPASVSSPVSPATSEPSESAPPKATSLGWTVAFVASTDVLNVRSAPDPNAPIVDRLPPSAGGFDMTGQTDQVGSELWREITTPTGQVGWVNPRYVVAQPTDRADIDWDLLQALTSEAGRWIRTGDGGAVGRGPSGWLAPSGLWIGGLLVSGRRPQPVHDDLVVGPPNP